MHNLEPVVLSHVACSGGSLIYRLLVSSFPLIGLSEVSHCFPFRDEVFMPGDPERGLLVAGVIDESVYADTFIDRIRHAIDLCKEKEKKVLIREHTHSYFFFSPPNAPIPDHPSWIAGQFRERFDQDIKCIITFRDPVDSWLGLYASFPEVTPTDFQEYCALYERFVRSVFENYDENLMLLVKYEDIVQDQARELHRIAEFLGIGFDGGMVQDWSRVTSTGNSGRQSNRVELRPRRPFGMSLIRDAEQSDSYAYLAEKLGYPHLREAVSTKTRLRAHLTDLRGVFASLLRQLLSPLNRWAHKRFNVP